VSADSAGLCAILKKSRRFDKANKVLNLNNGLPQFSSGVECYVLNFYQNDFDKKLIN
jgi:hypothetical protein